MKSRILSILILSVLLFSCEMKIKNKILETYPNGNIKSEFLYLNPLDSLEIQQIEYYPNGKIKFQGTFYDTTRNGLFQWYYQDGLISQMENYDSEGKLDSIANFYYDNGKIDRLIEFDHGEQIWETHYDSLGNFLHYSYNFNNKKYAVIELNWNNEFLIADSTVNISLNFPNIANNQITISVANGTLTKKDSKHAIFDLTPRKAGNLFLTFSICDFQGEDRIIGIKEFIVK